MQMLDSNTFYLNNHLHQQDLLEREWEMTKYEKREACVELARNILLQEIDRNTFELVFGYYILDDYEKEEWFISVLEDIEIGICDEVLKKCVIQEALEGSALCLYDCELEELLDDRLRFDEQLNIMIEEVGL